MEKTNQGKQTQKKPSRLIRGLTIMFKNSHRSVGLTSGGRPRGDVYTGNHKSKTFKKNRRKALKARSRRRQKTGRPVR